MAPEIIESLGKTVPLDDLEGIVTYGHHGGIDEQGRFVVGFITKEGFELAFRVDRKLAQLLVAKLSSMIVESFEVDKRLDL